MPPAVPANIRKSTASCFRSAVRRWMQSINMPITNQRELFLCRYAALQNLRGIVRRDPRCVQAAMEVLLNLSGDATRQNSYLRAVNARLTELIIAAASVSEIPANHGLVWDCPAHVPAGYRFGIVLDPEPRQFNAMAVADRELMVIEDDE
jgi:hypothetical protein